MSLILSKYFTIALRLFPWAETITFFPYKIAGAILSYQKGSTLSTVSFKHSVHGKLSNGKFSYLLSFPGNLSSVTSKAGGLIS